MLELADMIAVNKSDGPNRLRAEAAAAEYLAALHILQPSSSVWKPPVVLVSGLANEGLDDLWTRIEDHRRRTTKAGEFAVRRRAQQVKWMWSMLEERLLSRLRTEPAVKQRLPVLERAVAEGALAPTLAVDEIAGLLGI